MTNETYGMKIVNGSGTYIVDSTEDFAHFHKLGSGTITGATPSYPGSVDYGDLFFVKLPESGFVAQQLYTSGDRKVYSNFTGAKPWLEIGSIKGQLAAMSLWGDYGLTIFEKVKGAFTIVVKSAGNVGVNITNAGSGYTSAPTVSFSAAPGGGTTATGTAAIYGGKVDSITITNPGSGYTSAPTVSFSGGGGSSAAATASLATAGDVFLSEILVTDRGDGYAVDRVITIPDQHVGNGGATDLTFVVASNDSNGTITGLKTLTQTPTNRTPGTYTGVIPNVSNSEHNVIFSSMIGDSADIVSVGSFSDIGNNTSINIAINEAANYYVLIPGSMYYSAGGTTIKIGYTFNYSGSTLNSIDVHRERNGAPYTGRGNQAYMIIRYRS
tara:strand:+ start:663 stop:1811 length:1149 start_codon:yes stop_codon:yes gene_type:complete